MRHTALSWLDCLNWPCLRLQLLTSHLQNRFTPELSRSIRGFLLSEESKEKICIGKTVSSFLVKWRLANTENDIYTWNWEVAQYAASTKKEVSQICIFFHSCIYLYVGYIAGLQGHEVIL